MTLNLCKRLKSAELPSGTECVEGYCFNDSGIDKITLPSTLKEIDDDALRNRDNLKTVWIEEGCMLDVGSTRKRSGHSPSKFEGGW